MPLAPNGMYYSEGYLFYGYPSCGKSSCIMQWAEMHPDVTVFVLDGDNKFKRVWLADYEHVTNIDYHTVEDWPSLVREFEKIKKTLLAMPMAKRERQCIALEMVDKYWTWAQDHYAEEIMNMTRSQYLMKLRSDNPDKTGLSDSDSQNMWRIVKGHHNTDFIDFITDRLRCNLIVTSPAMPVSTIVSKGKPQESNEVLDLYAPIGHKAEGEKRNGYRVDTVIFLEYDYKTKKRYWTTVKEKSKPGAIKPMPQAWRREFTGNFFLDYSEFTGGAI